MDEKNENQEIISNSPDPVSFNNNYSVNCRTIEARIVVKKWWDWLIFATFLISVFSLWFSYHSQRTNWELDNNKQVPNVFIFEKSDGEKLYAGFFNAGPGVAYNIKVNTFINKNSNRSMGDIYREDIYLAAVALKSKDNKLISTQLQVGGERITNPPPIIPPSYESYFKVPLLNDGTFKSLDAIIEYEDSNKKKYYSIWNGIDWFFTDNFNLEDYLFKKDDDGKSVLLIRAVHNYFNYKLEIAGCFGESNLYSNNAIDKYLLDSLTTFYNFNSHETLRHIEDKKLQLNKLNYTKKCYNSYSIQDVLDNAYAELEIKQ